VSRYRILEAAAEELEQAAIFYQEASDSLGQDFIDEFESTMERVLHMPEAWAAFDPEYRRCLFRRFPFALVYRIEAGVVIVTSVFHQKRRPNSWRDNV